MIKSKKPSSITITIRDRKKNKSQSITVYDSTVEEVVRKVKGILK